jgi:hypothetical protein
LLKVNQVEALQDYMLKIELSNGKKGLFDVSGYLDKGVFTELKDINYFKQVKTFFCGISWPHNQDLSADTIEYELIEQ